MPPAQHRPGDGSYRRAAAGGVSRVLRRNSNRARIGAIFSESSGLPLNLQERECGSKLPHSKISWAEENRQAVEVSQAADAVVGLAQDEADGNALCNLVRDGCRKNLEFAISGGEL